MSDIVVVGSCVQDLVSYTSVFPRPGESVRGRSFVINCGGKGANQAVAAARLGASVAMVGMVGNDVFGPPTIDNFRREGINADQVTISEKAPTATATITVADSGENSIVVVLGANLEMGAAEVAASEALIKGAKVLCTQLEIPQETTLAALKLGRKHGVLTILNPAPGLPDLGLEALRVADVVCPNENEAEMLAGRPANTVAEAMEAAKAIRAKGGATVVVTLGGLGCVYLEAGSETPAHIPCPKVKAVDTTVWDKGSTSKCYTSKCYIVKVKKLRTLAMVKKCSTLTCSSLTVTLWDACSGSRMVEPNVKQESNTVYSMFRSLVSRSLTSAII